MNGFIQITTVTEGKSLRVMIRKDSIVSITEAVDGSTVINLSTKEYKEMQSFFHAVESFDALSAQLM